MSSFYYLIPVIFSLPVGHRIDLAIPPDLLRRRLNRDGADVDIVARALIEGREVWTEARTVPLTKSDSGGEPIVLSFENDAAAHGGANGYLEVEFLSTDGNANFSGKAPPELYGIYTIPGRQSFRADGSYKFGVPSVIASVTAYKVFVEAFPVVDLDRTENRLESMTFVNPYSRPLVVTLATVDNRKLPRVKVPAQSVRWVALEGLLRDGEDKLRTRLQLSATNRVVSYHVRHGAGTIPVITDHEHLDIFRADPTHVPISLYLRERFARNLRQRFGIAIGR